MERDRCEFGLDCINKGSGEDLGFNSGDEKCDRRFCTAEIPSFVYPLIISIHYYLNQKL